MKTTPSNISTQRQIPRRIRGLLFAPAVHTAALAVISLAFTNPASGTTTTISTATTTKLTLAANDSLNVTATGSLTIASGNNIAVTVTGNSTITNLGTIDDQAIITGSNAGNGRVIRDNTGGLTLTVTNGSSTNSTALMQTADADVIQMKVAGSNVTFNNYGTLNSKNSSAGGNQAVDWASLTSGNNTLNNYSTGNITASEADAVRPGVNGVVNNAGTIKSTWSTTSSGSSSDGVDVQTNTGVSITNANNWSSGTPATPGTGLIEGARHGITGGPLTNISFTTSITNNLGGTIQGDTGSGINLDGFSALQSATIINNGTITGNGRDIGNSLSHDGDGLDVDGLVNVTNTGIIRSINSFNIAADGVAHSEGITVGGGTITNSGTIEGLVAVGNTNAIGFGITLLGNDSLTLPGTREAIYGNSTVTNLAGGLIRGDSSSGIFVDGPASGFTVTINNNASATIRGGAILTGLGATSAAIFTGADNDSINNAGTIDGSSNGKAIEMGAGNNTLNVTGGSASISGDISGGTGGTNAMTVNPGAGNSFTYIGTISNFGSVAVQSGTVTLSGNSTYAGTTAVTGGKLLVNGDNSAANGNIAVSSGATLGGSGKVGGATTFTGASIHSPGAAGSGSVGTQTFSSTLAYGAGTIFEWDLTSGASDPGANTANSGSYDKVVTTGAVTGGSAVFKIINSGSYADAFWNTNKSWSDIYGGAGMPATLGALFSTFSGTGLTVTGATAVAPGEGQFTFNGATSTLNWTAVPEPTSALAGLLLGAGLLRRRRAV